MRFEELDIERQISFSQMWTSERGDWVVTRSPEGYLGIFNRTKRLAKLIESESLHDAVVEKMIQERIPIVDQLTLFRELSEVKDDDERGAAPE